MTVLDMLEFFSPFECEVWLLESVDPRKLGPKAGATLYFYHLVAKGNEPIQTVLS